MVTQSRQYFRHELKYSIDVMQYQILRKKLALVLKLDPHAGPNKTYHVRSIYFDDFKNTALFEKQSGVSQRKKYRIRIYNYNDNYIKFERKTKFNQYVHKDWSRISREEAEKMISGDFSFLENTDNQLFRDAYLQFRCNLLRPVVAVDYVREAYVHPVGNVRVTFDMALHTNLGKLSLFERTAPTMGVDEECGIILEIKFDDVLPLHIRGLFPSTIRAQSANGKFAICRESTNALTGCSVIKD